MSYRNRAGFGQIPADLSTSPESGSGCQFSAAKIQSLLPPEDLIADDVAGGAEAAAIQRRPRVGGTTLGPARLGPELHHRIGVEADLGDQARARGWVAGVQLVLPHRAQHAMRQLDGGG